MSMALEAINEGQSTLNSLVIAAAIIVIIAAMPTLFRRVIWPLNSRFTVWRTWRMTRAVPPRIGQVWTSLTMSASYRIENVVQSKQGPVVMMTTAGAVSYTRFSELLSFFDQRRKTEKLVLVHSFAAPAEGDQKEEVRIQ